MLVFMQNLEVGKRINDTHLISDYWILFKGSTIDGADKGEMFVNSDTVFRNMLSFWKRALDY